MKNWKEEFNPGGKFQGIITDGGWYTDSRPDNIVTFIENLLKQEKLKAIDEKIEIYKKIEKDANEGYIVPFHKYIKDLQEQKKLLTK